ncbi:MAG: coproporphyrinogen dehydrogenase HemZ [Clostridia bacterium]|nr:coproporphyrinogen dehydrogenase HemZ [Clostridia bacterium]
MLSVFLEGHENYYALSDVIRLFWNKISENRNQRVITCSDCLEDVSIFSRVNSDLSVETFININESVKYSADSVNHLEPIETKRELKRQLYILLEHYTGKSFPWGCLTGIRPTLVAGEYDNYEDVKNLYLVREDKAKLAYEVKKSEDRMLSKHSRENLNIYVGVPFCPSRCEYCSFISQDIAHHINRLEDYERALKCEIKYLGKRINREIDSLYIGGGTPTVFDDKLFENMLQTVMQDLPISTDTEITVEAGRPDTITDYKLDVIRDLGVKRICINPQTMNSTTLTKLNRRHTAEDIVNAYKMAVNKGIEIINMDLIAGLKYEEPEELILSLKKLFELNPANITIHTLYKKRSSAMSKQDIVNRLQEDRKLDSAVSMAYELLEEKGYFPYYMYRQKDTGHGLENVGFARSGTECYYNVAMMTDARDVLSFGAGGMSKRVFEEISPGKYRVERHSCVKDVLLYIKNVEDIASRKADFFNI